MNIRLTDTIDTRHESLHIVDYCLQYTKHMTSKKPKSSIHSIDQEDPFMTIMFPHPTYAYFVLFFGACIADVPINILILNIKPIF